MLELSAWLNETLGDPTVVGAGSWFEVVSWVAGAVIVLIALAALRHRVFQARATFILHLMDQWRELYDARKETVSVLKELTTEVFGNDYRWKDQIRMEKLRTTCEKSVAEIEDKNPKLFAAFIQYLTFFETVGVLVRNRYVPLRDILRLFEGPIDDIDVMFRLHIEQMQRRAEVTPGLFENLLSLIRRTRRRQRWRQRLYFWRT